MANNVLGSQDVDMGRLVVTLLPSVSSCQTCQSNRGREELQRCILNYWRDCIDRGWHQYICKAYIHICLPYWIDDGDKQLLRRKIRIYPLVLIRALAS